MRSIYLSVVIPSYNEASRLPATLEKVIAYLQAQTYTSEIVVVDDGSTDQTVEVVKSFVPRFPELRLLQNSVNQGKGAVVRQGMLRVFGQYRLFSDADLSTPIEEVEQLLSALNKGTDIAIASRAVKGSIINKHQPLYRELFGKTFNFLVKSFYLKGLHDTQCGFKLYTAAAAEIVFSRQQLTSIVFDVEDLYIAKQHHLKITEVPVTWVNDAETRIKPTLRNALLVLQDLYRIRRHHLSVR